MAKEQARGGIDKSKPEAGPKLVLVKDPHDGLKNPPIPAYGSYLVFRKLEQNVRGFQDQLDELAKALQLQGHDRQRAEALVMGRFRDGTPVVLQATPGQHDPVPNNFDFADDALGLKCPFQAHIRRMNPRGERDRIIQNTLLQNSRSSRKQNMSTNASIYEAPLLQNSRGSLVQSRQNASYKTPRLKHWRGSQEQRQTNAIALYETP